MDVADKLEILADAAKYDVACTSSGIDRDAQKGKMGNTLAAGICHSFSADGRCITLLKVLMTNVCVYDCAYCVNRASNEVPRVAFKPRELADLTIAFYRRNYTEGLFLSSGVIRNPDYTTELMVRTLSILRHEYGFRGYIHAKAVPGTSPALIDQLGHLADRMSVNMETSLAEEPGAAGSRQEQAAHPGAHAPDQGEHRRGQGHARPHAQGDHVHDPGAPQEEGARVRASRAEHADDHRRHAGERLPDTEPVGRTVPLPFAQARLLQRLPSRERGRAPAVLQTPCS